jgi:hypothetical protein
MDRHPERATVEVLLRGIELSDSFGSPEPLAFWWTDPESGLWHRNSVDQLVAFLEDGSGRVLIEVDGRRVDVAVSGPDRQGRRVLRALVDGRWTDDLLALPRM